MKNRTCRRPFLKASAALGAVLLLALPVLAWSQALSLLYATKFEEPEFVAGLPLVIQDGWVGVPPLSPLAAVITNEQRRQGHQSVKVWGGDLVDFGPVFPYAAVGSYRRPLNHIVSSQKPIVVMEANLLLETDQPASAMDDFFSLTIAARSGDGETLGEMGLSSSGRAVAYGFDVDPGVDPEFTAPIAFNEWHRVSIVMDFSGETTVVSYFIDDVYLGTVFTASSSDELLRGSMVVYALPDGDGDARANFTARFDNLRISTHGGN